jgi:hypothetical protein
LVLVKYLRLVLQHREGIYWCSAPLHDEDQRSYKVRNVADVQAAPPPPIDDYVSNSTVRSDNEAPAALRRAPSKVAAPRRTRQTAGNIPASQAATQVAEAMKRRGKRTRSAVSTDTTTISSNVETIDVDDEGGDVQSPKETMVPSPGKQAVETPRPTSRMQGRSTSSTDPAGNVGSIYVEHRDGNGDPIPDSPRGIPLLGDGDGTNLIPAGI